MRAVFKIIKQYLLIMLALTSSTLFPQTESVACNSFPKVLGSTTGDTRLY